MSPLIPASACLSWLCSGSSGCEKMWRSCKDLPQYQYIARPTYKFAASKTNLIIATAASFFVTDLIMHQLLPQTAICICKNVFSTPSSCDIGWSPEASLAWMTLALPVMYVKYTRLRSN